SRPTPWRRGSCWRSCGASTGSSAGPDLKGADPAPSILLNRLAPVVTHRLGGLGLLPRGRGRGRGRGLRRAGGFLLQLRVRGQPPVEGGAPLQQAAGGGLRPLGGGGLALAEPGAVDLAPLGPGEGHQVL